MTAVLSPDGAHRYRLTRTWPAVTESPRGPDGVAVHQGRVLFVMLNPSIADASVDDPTIRKCRGFAARWGYAELEVVNLFSLRATKPTDLWASDRRNTEESDSHILSAIAMADQIVVAWGQQPKARPRARVVERLIRDSLPEFGRFAGQLWCIGGPAKSAMEPVYPRHPLMLAYSLQLTEWPRAS